MELKTSVQDSITQQISRFGYETAKAFSDLHESDKLKKEAVWHTGWPLFDRAITSLDAGLCIVGGVENCGKSNFVNCLEMGILDNTDNCLVVDFILDNDRKTRIHQLAAAKGKIPMDYIAIPNLMEKGDERHRLRTKAYASLITDYQGKLEILDSSSWGDRGAYLENIVKYLTNLRDFFPDKKIWVTIDAFDDPKLPAGVRMEERVMYTSSLLKDTCNRLGIVIMAVKHMNKGNRGRVYSGDAFKGSSGLLYDAQLALLAYSEMAELGQSANLYFNPDPQDYSKKSPIFEVYFQKNKVGGFKGDTLFFQQWPEYYYCTEAGEKDQQFFRNALLSQLGAKKSYR